MAKDKGSEAREAALSERETALDDKEGLLDAKIEELAERETALDDKSNVMSSKVEDLAAWETDLEKREKALAKAGAKPKGPGPKRLTSSELQLIEDARKAYGIASEFILDAGIDDKGRAVVVTKGGSRVRYYTGDEKAEGFEPLSDIQIDGVIRKKPRHLIGKKKEK
jgi:hypothetical protein